MKNRFFIITSFFLFYGFFSNIFCSPVKNNSTNITNENTETNIENINEKEIIVPKGVELSNKVYLLLTQKNLSPEIQDLLQNGKNSFPYNVLVNIESETPTNKNLIFTFYQEDVIKNQNTIGNFVKYVKDQNFQFNTIFLFSYGENQTIKKEGMIYGVDTFLNTINTNDDYTNIIVDLSSNENSVITSSNGNMAPSWLIQNEYNSFIKHKIDENIPNFYLSQMYTYRFFQDRLLSSFFEYDIPSIKINFSNAKLNSNIVFSVLKDSVNSYNADKDRLWDHHFFMARINDKYKKLTEEVTIQIIIVIILLWLLFITLLIFINTRRKKQAWATVSHIWYSVPITFILSVIGFIIGKNIALAFFQTESIIHNTFIIVESQLIMAFILVSIYYAVTLLYNFSFYEKSIDYLIIISCFLNQSFFILIDISLFPLFMIICFLSVISLYIKSNAVHIAVFFLMSFSFIPYVFSIINYANFDSLYNFIISEKLISFFVPLIIYPSFLIYFRILTSVRRKTKISIPSLISLIIIATSLITVMTGTLKGESLIKNNNSDNETFILVTTEDLIDFEYKDKNVFDDLIRTINIKFAEQPEQCSITINSKSKSPILYTDNDFEYINPTTSMFNIPSAPPKKLTFSYCASQEPSIISISAVFPVENGKDYKTTKKVVRIE